MKGLNPFSNGRKDKLTRRPCDCNIDDEDGAGGGGGTASDDDVLAYIDDAPVPMSSMLDMGMRRNDSRQQMEFLREGGGKFV